MSGYCKYCDTLTNSIIKVYESGVLIWTGCPSCYARVKELKNNAAIKK